MAETGIFISSCSRREWARRRPGRSTGALPVPVAIVLLVVLAMALTAVVLARAGL